MSRRTPCAKKPSINTSAGRPLSMRSPVCKWVREGTIPHSGRESVRNLVKGRRPAVEELMCTRDSLGMLPMLDLADLID